jgi:hypothetical protein
MQNIATYSGAGTGRLDVFDTQTIFCFAADTAMYGVATERNELVVQDRKRRY